MLISKSKRKCHGLYIWLKVEFSPKVHFFRSLVTRVVLLEVVELGGCVTKREVVRSLVVYFWKGSSHQSLNGTQLPFHLPSHLSLSWLLMWFSFHMYAIVIILCLTEVWNNDVTWSETILQTGELNCFFYKYLVALSASL